MPTPVSRPMGSAPGLAASSAILDLLLPEAQRPVLRRLAADLHGNVSKAKAHEQWCAGELEKTRAQALTTEPAEMVRVAFAEAQQHYLILRDQLTTLKKELADDQQKRTTHHELAQELTAQKAETRRWAAMYELLGSKDKSKFSRFAQGLTLARLVSHANHHLRQFNERYTLQRRDATSLGLQVADSYDAIVRDVGTLSGGETFLVSLALALGLSELASHSARIDSLFIDEGFGTLDADTLDVALAALGSLRQRGKTIGIITHVDVDRLKDYGRGARGPGHQLPAGAARSSAAGTRAALTIALRRLLPPPRSSISSPQFRRSPPEKTPRPSAPSLPARWTRRKPGGRRGRRIVRLW